MSTHLVIPDTHARPADNIYEYINSSKNRFRLLGKLILDIKPDNVIFMGDFGDFESLSTYDKGKISAEGKRIQEDINAIRTCLNLVFDPMDKFNHDARANKKKQYKPDIYMLGGNHEEGRINKAVSVSPELAGFLSVESIGFEDYDMTYVPYQVPLELDGIMYCHHFASGVMGKPIGGVNMAKTLLKRNHMSTTVGHSHIFDYAMETRADGKRIHGLSAGCLVGNFNPSYAKETTKFWWQGVVLKTMVNDGDYSMKQITLNELETVYGQG